VLIIDVVACNVCLLPLNEIRDMALKRGNTNFSLGETLQMKKMDMDCPNAVHYALTELPSIMPNLETLVIGSPTEVYYLNLRCCSLVISTQYTSHLVYNESET